MPRYKLTIEYDGTGLVGWQKQENGPSVQQFLEEAIEALTQERIETVGSGRTDAGVHALGQVVHFDLEKNFEEHNIRDGLNHHLKKNNISVISAEIVDGEFHARFDAKKRKYLYRILPRKSPPALRKGKVWHVYQPIDIQAMEEASKCLIGKHDFTSFRATVCQAKSPVKTLDKIEIEQKDDEIHVTVEARSFLHHMVRNIVGTLVQVGIGKWQPDDVKKALEAKDRSAAGLNAPAEGLYFVEVKY